MKSFAQILQDHNMTYTSFVDEHAQEDLEDFWTSLVQGSYGHVSDSDLKAVLDTYEDTGIIKKINGKAKVKPYIPPKLDEPTIQEEKFHPELQIKQTRKPSFEILYSDAHELSEEHPIIVLEDPKHIMHHHETGDFLDPDEHDAFEFKHEKAMVAKIIKGDSRFIKLLRWLGSGRICVRLSGYPVKEGYAVYKIRAVDPNGNETLSSANNSFIQLIIKRLTASGPISFKDLEAEEDDEEEDSTILLSDMPGMIDFMATAGDTLPPNIRTWAHRNIAMVKSDTISNDEKRHAQRALSIMLNIQWQNSYFSSIDPIEARKILDEELYGMDDVKQRVIETIIQINRTHTLPGYGLLLVGPAGTGKSQIAYAVAKILKMPWISLDMSTIHDAEALTGSPRVYSNAKPGRIMEAFENAGSSNLVFIINELDKADSGNSLSNPADTLLTLLDGLGFTDNYIECTIPTNGVYPIATANDRSKISDPLLSRFAVIDIPDYTNDERKIIFTDYVMPKVMKRLGMKKGECVLTDGGIDVIIQKYEDQPGVRGLEQAAEHILGNALYRIETESLSRVIYDQKDIEDLLSH